MAGDRSERSGRKAGGLPFVPNMTDGMDLLRRMWGVTGLPGLPTAAGISQFAQGLPQALPSMITPTLDVEELDKRIADLRAVEQWLALNANMLRATIQSLEVQRNTIATLKSFGGSMLASVTRQSGNDPHGEATDPQHYLRQAQARTAARHKAAADAADAAAAAAAEAAALAAMAPPPVSAPAPAAPTRRRPTPARARKSAASDVASGGAPAMPLNPAAWWGALQDQFTRVAAAAAAESTRAAKGAKVAASGKPARRAEAAQDESARSARKSAKGGPRRSRGA